MIGPLRAFARDNTSRRECRPAWLSPSVIVAPLACLFLAAPDNGAAADTRLDIRYSVSVAKIAVGEATWTTNIGADRYTAAATGQASGVASMLFAGTGAATVSGRIVRGRFDAEDFTADLAQNGDKTDLRMTLDGGNVTNLAVTSAAPEEDRVPVTEQHQRGILDPLTAMLIPAPAGAFAPTRDACARTLPIFDGRRRYDLALSYKRMNTVKTARGYAGPVVVCAVALHPISGHDADSRIMKYLADGRDIEIWLAPVAREKVLAPFRLSVSSILGDLLIQATQFETLPRVAAKPAQ